MPEPLPLYPGAVPCVRCGHCCRVRSCGYGEWDSERGKCKELTENEDGTFSCAMYEKIIANPEWQWAMCPAFGAGCCSAFNSDRRAIVRRSLL